VAALLLGRAAAGKAEEAANEVADIEEEATRHLL
jgi:hypothetical protein